MSTKYDLTLITVAARKLARDLFGLIRDGQLSYAEIPGALGDDWIRDTGNRYSLTVAKVATGVYVATRRGQSIGDALADHRMRLEIAGRLLRPLVIADDGGPDSDNHDNDNHDNDSNSNSNDNLSNNDKD